MGRVENVNPPKARGMDRQGSPNKRVGRIPGSSVVNYRMMSGC